MAHVDAVPEVGGGADDEEDVPGLVGLLVEQEGGLPAAARRLRRSVTTLRRWSAGETRPGAADLAALVDGCASGPASGEEDDPAGGEEREQRQVDEDGGDAAPEVAAGPEGFRRAGA